jgi:hypothetical protein
MTKMVEACNPRLPAVEFIEKVLEEVRLTLRRVSDHTNRK